MEASVLWDSLMQTATPQVCLWIKFLLRCDGGNQLKDGAVALSSSPPLHQPSQWVILVRSPANASYVVSELPLSFCPSFCILYFEKSCFVIQKLR